MKLVGFTTVNGNEVVVNPEHVVAIHAFGLHDSEINLINGIDVQVRNLRPMQVGRLLAEGRP
ncbi:RepA-like helicase [Rhodococcus phage Jflix2]|nr:RepA-like helicase [Rhodococcus phage Jflix2]